ncbi:MAG: UDP-N-acetylmuramate dehydrogenase [Actinomycetota bacterium]
MKGSVRLRHPMANLTSFKVGGAAGILAEPQGEQDLLVIASVIKDLSVRAVVLGRGTNVLMADAGFGGIVIRLGDPFEWIRGSDNFVEAGGATALPQIANWAARRSLTGMEFAVAIPATVGGAVRMNAGAHGEAISKVLVTANVCRLDEAAIEIMDQQSLLMSYRDTALGPRDVVCSARFELIPGDHERIIQTMTAHRQHRTATQPSEGPNAGSVFRNPPHASAGKLIESADLKGASVGSAQISTKHGNFIVAHPGARAQEIFDLMVQVQTTVLEKFNILLIPEVRLIGEFAGAERLVVDG